jgi:hypothetical protein
MLNSIPDKIFYTYFLLVKKHAYKKMKSLQYQRKAKKAFNEMKKPDTCQDWTQGSSTENSGIATSKESHQLLRGTNVFSIWTKYFSFHTLLREPDSIPNWRSTVLFIKYVDTGL